MGRIRASATWVCALVLAVALAAVRPWSPRQRPAPPHRRVDVLGLASAPDQRWAPLVDGSSGRPHRLLDPDVTMVVDPAVVELVGLQPVTEGLTAFNDTPGSAVSIDVDVRRAADPDWHLTLEDCSTFGEDEGRARPRVATVDRFGAWVDGATIEVCPSVRDRSRPLVRHLLAHEVAHVLGFGHLCNDPGCWPLDEPADPCEFMSPSVHPCQDLEVVRPALASLYPDGAPPYVGRAEVETPRHALHGTIQRSKWLSTKGILPLPMHSGHSGSVGVRSRVRRRRRMGSPVSGPANRASPRSHRHAPMAVTCAPRP